MATASKPRQPRLRASCDGCFLAKVKCSKTRPLCSRCMACGTECRYSPSSRAGKPKSDTTSAGVKKPGSSRSPKLSSTEYPMIAPLVPATQGLEMMGMETAGWHPGMPMDGRHSSMSSIRMPWTPPLDISTSFSSVSMAPAMALDQSTPQTIDSTFMPMGLMTPWIEASSSDMMGYPPSSLPTPPTMTAAYFPSPACAKVAQSAPRSPPSCACFKTCLQALNNLHEMDSHSFDLVLKLNAKAVDGCADMLACALCMGRYDKDTVTMLLAVVIAKITTIYRDATVSTCQVNLSDGYAMAHGENRRWMELDLLGHELAKLQALYTRFSDACITLPRPAGNMDIGRAMVGYVGQNLSNTLEAVRNSQMGSQPAVDLTYA